MCNWMLRASDRVTKLPNWIGSNKHSLFGKHSFSEFQFKNRYVPWRCQQSDVIFRPCYASIASAFLSKKYVFYNQTNKVCSECPTRRAAGGTKGTKGFHSWHCRWEPNDRTRCGTPRDGSASGRNGSLCRSATIGYRRTPKGAPPAKHRNI